MSALHWLRILVVTLVCVSLGVWLTWRAIDALRCGVAQTNLGVHRRDSHPLLFWLAVFVYALFAVTAFYALLVSVRS